MYKLFFLLLFSLASCGSDSPAWNQNWHEIRSRGPRIPLYRINAPEDWSKIDPDPDDTLEDTTKPICQFAIGDKILISIHSFPTRIPSQMQVERWKKQFESIESLEVVPQAFGGFAGYRFCCIGTQKGQSQAVLAWAMQLAPEHFSAFGFMRPALPEEILKEKRSDYTIKVTGEPEHIDTYRSQIIAFARSFELIEEIPPLP